MRALLLAALLAAISLSSPARTLRWSSQGDLMTADPQAQNEGLNNMLMGYAYERLTTRDKELRLVPSLARSWQQVNPTTWRFDLRRGVTFHDGTPFTAADVVFSIERAQTANSNFKTFAVPLGKARAIDDHTVEIVTPRPHPLLLEDLNTIYIMSRAWATRNRAELPQDFKSAEDTFASRAANGTGPYVFVSREPEVRVAFRKNPLWWGLKEGRFEGNVDEIVYRPIKSDATRMAAVISGELDFVLDPPLQDIGRLKGNPKVTVIEGPENRIVFLVMDQSRDELRYSNVKGRNPFKDKRVREALYHAIDIEALKAQVMRGQSRPTGSMVPAESASPKALEPRLGFDPPRAKQLLAEAGYPDGFEVALLCPNNRYVNDERICTALTAMFARVGVRASLTTLPRAQFFQKVDQLDFSLHMYGWGGAVTDPGRILMPLLHSFDGKGKGDFNSGRFKDEALDRLIDRSDVEMDPKARAQLLAEALKIVRDNSYAIPLHRQVIPWVARAGVKVVHRADNLLEPLWVTLP
jgi:peptide/nickel transport system substrate-binding protein